MAASLSGGGWILQQGRSVVSRGKLGRASCVLLLAAGGVHCSFDFSLKTLATPGLMAALAALGLVALLPAILKRTGLLRRTSRDP